MQLLENKRVQGFQNYMEGSGADKWYNPGKAQAKTKKFGGIEQMVTGKEVPVPESPTTSAFKGVKKIVVGKAKTMLPTARARTEGNREIAEGASDILVGDVPQEAPQTSAPPELNSGNPEDMPSGDDRYWVAGM